MRTLSFTWKKSSFETLDPEILAQALAGAEDEVGVKAPLMGDPGAKPDKSVEANDVQQSAAEASSQSHLRVATPPLPSNATSTPTSKVGMSSSPLNRLRRMMRSQSDGGIIISGLSLVPIATTPSDPVVLQLEPGAAVTSEQTGQHGEDASTIPSPVTKTLDSPGIRAAPTPGSTTSEPRASDKDGESDLNGSSSAAIANATAAACDVFLNASIQLLHSQSDARQRVRQLWLTIQRLRYESQLSDTGVELLHTELLAIMKSFSMEKLEGARHLKTGYLTLVQAPDMLSSRPPLMAKSLFGGGGGVSARPALGQRMWCTLSEEYGKFEMTPVRDESGSASSSPSSTGGVSSSPLVGLGNKLKLPTSLSSLLADAFQQAMPSPLPPGNPEPARAIKLRGCQVRKIPVVTVKAAETGLFSSLNDGVTTTTTTNTATDLQQERHQIQILVPNSRSSAEHVNPSSGSAQMSYSSIYAFEVAEGDEQDWLRNRIDRYDHQLHGGNSTGHQQMLFQHQHQQRRSSKNMSIVQIIKDLERDKVLVDQKLITTTTTSDSNNGGGSRSEQGNISEVVKYVVMKVMDFVRKAEQRAKNERTTTTYRELFWQPSSFCRVFKQRIHNVADQSIHKVLGGKSAGVCRACAARKLAHAERGDIYDAISFFCQHTRVSICPVSQDACPVQMNIVSDDACELFQVEIQVCMRFKVVEMTPMTTTTSSPVSAVSSLSTPAPPDSPAPADRTSFSSSSDLFFENTERLTADHLTFEGPKEWAVLEGTLSRQFTLGKLSEPGAVTINFIPRENSSSSS